MANRVARYTLKAVCILLIVFGVHGLSASVDVTPVIGSPQFDYVGFDLDKPFWPQFLLVHLPMSLAMGLIAALALFIVGLRPASRVRHIALFWTITFLAVAVWRLAVWPLIIWHHPSDLGDAPRLLRYAVPNGLVTASILTLLHVFVGWRFGLSAGPRRSLPTAVRWWAVLTLGAIAFGVALSLIGGLDLMRNVRNVMIPFVVVMLFPAVLAGFAARQDRVG